MPPILKLHRNRNQLKLRREGTALPVGAYAADPRNENQSKAPKEDTALQEGRLCH